MVATYRTYGLALKCISHQLALAKRRVVVVIRGQALQVAQVWVHAAFEDQVVSLVSLWETKEYDPHLGFATALKKDEAEFINTHSIICAIPFCNVKDDLYRVLLPVHLRK